jgi:hypothetical protein
MHLDHTKQLDEGNAFHTTSHQLNRGGAKGGAWQSDFFLSKMSEGRHCLPLRQPGGADQRAYEP